MSDFDLLCRRVNRLERRERQWRYLTLGALASAAICWLISPSPTTGAEQEEKVISATHFFLKDSQGNSRAFLAVVEDNPVLTFVDANRQKVMTLGLQGKAPGLWIGDSKGKTQVALGLGGAGPTLTFLDSRGKSRVMLSSTDDQQKLYFYNGQEKRRITIGTEDDADMVALWDDAGQTRAGLGISKEQTFLALVDRNKKRFFFQGQ